MSLHAQLSPEAQEALAKQQRNTTVSSIVISILTFTLLFVGLLCWWLEPAKDLDIPITAYIGKNQEKKPLSKPEIKRSIQNNPSPPASAHSRAMAAQTKSSIVIPVTDIETPNPTADMGLGEDFGTGSEDGTGFGTPSYKRLPVILNKRCSPNDRLDRLNKNGGTKQCEEAVIKSLRWLKKTQNADGSWTNSHKVAMTGFALLTYLGHCETPNSEEFGDSVIRAMTYLINTGIKNNGKLAVDTKDKHWPYEHSIATYALAEATTFCNSLGIPFPKLKETTKAAGDWILEHQHTSGSWDYAYDMSGNRGGDTSIALWHIQALKACKHTQLWKNKVFKSCIKKSLTYLKQKQAADGGVGYASPSPTGEAGYTMTGGAMLAFQMWSKGHDSTVRNGAKYIRKNAKLDYNSQHADLYRHYYHVQAMMNRGGQDWHHYNLLFRDQILNNQNTDGSYKNVGGGAKVKAVAPSYQGNSAMAKHYRTCLATLMLETYYRFLPSAEQ